MKSKWLKFRLTSKGYKTSHWSVENKIDNEHLGFITWYSQWRQYCFMPDTNTIYSQGCLREVADFIKKQMDKRKKIK